MNMKIDGTAVVPVGWVFTGMAVIISTTVVGAFWIAAVNYRLQRIEEKLGIPAYHAEISPVSNAYGSEQKQHGLPDSF